MKEYRMTLEVFAKRYNNVSKYDEAKFLNDYSGSLKKLVLSKQSPYLFSLVQGPRSRYVVPGYRKDALTYLSGTMCHPLRNK